MNKKEELMVNEIIYLVRKDMLKGVIEILREYDAADYGAIKAIKDKYGE